MQRAQGTRQRKKGPSDRDRATTSRPRGRPRPRPRDAPRPRAAPGSIINLHEPLRPLSRAATGVTSRKEPPTPQSFAQRKEGFQTAYLLRPVAPPPPRHNHGSHARLLPREAHEGLDALPEPPQEAPGPLPPDACRLFAYAPPLALRLPWRQRARGGVRSSHVRAVGLGREKGQRHHHAARCRAEAHAHHLARSRTHIIIRCGCADLGFETAAEAPLRPFHRRL